MAGDPWIKIDLSHGPGRYSPAIKKYGWANLSGVVSDRVTANVLILFIKVLERCPYQKSCVICNTFIYVTRRLG